MQGLLAAQPLVRRGKVEGRFVFFLFLVAGRASSLLWLDLPLLDLPSALLHLFLAEALLLL